MLNTLDPIGLARQLQATIVEVARDNVAMIARFEPVHECVALANWSDLLATLYDYGHCGKEFIWPTYAGGIFLQIANWMVRQGDSGPIVSVLLSDSQVRKWHPTALMLHEGMRVLASKATLDQTAVNRLVVYATANGLSEIVEELEKRGMCVSPPMERELERWFRSAGDPGTSLLARNLNGVLSKHLPRWSALRVRRVLEGTEAVLPVHQ